MAYAIGVTTFEGVTQQEWDIDPLVLAKGMIDAKKGEPILNKVAADGFISIYMREQQDEKLSAEYGTEIEEGKIFLKENSIRAGVLVTNSGLQYEVLTLGDGPKPVAEDKVRVHYSGTLIDGTKFDSSLDRGEPAEFAVTGVIQGWIEGLQLMPVGSKYKFFIPYDLAYGPRGAGATIKPYSTLVFEIELLDIITSE